MEAVITVFKKELHRIFKDKKMLFSTFVLPVFIMIIIYGLVGNMTEKLQKEMSQYSPSVYIVNSTDKIQKAMAGPVLDLSRVSEIDGMAAEDTKELIKAQAADLLIVFPASFDADIENDSGMPNVEIYYNPDNMNSANAYTMYLEMMQDQVYKSYLADKVGGADKLDIFTVNMKADGEASYELSDEDNSGSQMLATLVPYMVVILLFSGAMSMGTDIIAGEKERGTMASLLLTPAKRSSIAMGKLLALTVITVISATLYSVTMVIMVPKAMGEALTGGGFNITVGQGAMVFAIIIALAFFYVNVVTLVSVFAKSVKEAQSYTTPFMILVVIAGVLTMFNSFSSGGQNIFLYAIPVYGSALCLSDIFSGTAAVGGFAVNVICTLLISVLLTMVISRVFDNEHVMMNS